MRNIIFFVLIGGIIFSLPAYSKKTKPVFNSDLDSVSYCIGLSIAKNFKQSGIKEINTEALSLGIKDIFSGNPEKINSQNVDSILNAYFIKIQNNIAKENIEMEKKFFTENKKNEGVIELPSGLQYKVITQGTGPKPSPTDVVVCHYEGKLINGKVFDSSYDRGEPVSFQLNKVIPGWTEALQLMSVGSKWILYIPSALAYGENGAGDIIGPNETLIFTVELLDIQ